MVSRDQRQITCALFLTRAWTAGRSHWKSAYIWRPHADALFSIKKGIRDAVLGGGERFIHTRLARSACQGAKGISGGFHRNAGDGFRFSTLVSSPHPAQPLANAHRRRPLWHRPRKSPAVAGPFPYTDACLLTTHCADVTPPREDCPHPSPVRRGRHPATDGGGVASGTGPETSNARAVGRRDAAVGHPWAVSPAGILSEPTVHCARHAVGRVKEAVSVFAVRMAGFDSMRRAPIG